MDNNMQKRIFMSGAISQQQIISTVVRVWIKEMVQFADMTYNPTCH